MTWFVDAGAHRGESIRLARRIYGAGLNVLAVEPLAACWSDLEEEGAIVVPAALWTAPGLRPLYLGAHEVSASLVADKRSGGVTGDRAVDVACVTLAGLLRGLPAGEVVHLKLDIEGAEYDVLGQALALGLLSRICDLYVDFHADRILGFPVDRHNALVGRLLSMGFTLPKWSPIDDTVAPCGEKWILR